MKRKFSLMLAAVMLLSSIPFLGLSAAAEINYTAVDYLPDKSLVVSGARSSATVTAATTGMHTGTYDGTIGDGNDYEYVTDNAWFNITGMTAASSGGVTPANRSFQLAISGADYLYAREYVPYVVQVPDTTKPIVDAGGLAVTDPLWVPTYEPKDETRYTYVYTFQTYESGARAGFDPDSSTADSNGEYSKIEWKNSAGTVLFTLDITGSAMNVTFPNAATEISIPISFYIGTAQDVKLKITGQTTTSSNSLPTGNTTISAVSSSSATLSIASVKGDRDKVNLDTVKITEGRKGVLRDGGWIKLTLTRGYIFTSTGNIKTSVLLPSGKTVTPTIELRKDAEELYLKIAGLDAIRSDYDSGLVLQIEGISVEPDDDTADTDYYGTTVKLTVEGVDYYYEGGTNTKITSGVYSLNVSKQTIEAASFSDYGCKITFADSAAAATTSYAGRKEIKAGFKGDDVAKLKFEEVTAGTWAIDRTLEIYLSDADGKVLDGVKLNEVEITKTSETNGLAKVLLNRKGTSGEAELTRTKFTTRGTSINKDKQGSMEFTVLFNAAADFEGDVYVAITGRAVGGDVVVSPKVATLSIPISIKTTKTNVPVGIQTYRVSDIAVTENEAGVLDRAKELTLAVKEFVTRTSSSNTSDVEFNPISSSNVSVTDGDIKTSSVTLSGGEIIIDITRESTKASTIQVSNLAVKVGGSAPQGYHSLIVGGDSWVETYWYDYPESDNYTSWDALKKANDDMGTWPMQGLVVENYIQITSTAANPVLTKNVVLYIGEDQAVIDGREVTLSAPSYILNDRTMLPVRAIAEVLEVVPEKVIWDNSARTATLFDVNNKTITWTIDSEVMTVNNVSMRMLEADGTPIKAVINPDNERTYVPYRYLGVGLGIDVLYIPDASGTTQGQAVLNPTDSQKAEAEQQLELMKSSASYAVDEDEEEAEVDEVETDADETTEDETSR